MAVKCLETFGPLPITPFSISPVIFLIKYYLMKYLIIFRHLKFRSKVGILHKTDKQMNFIMGSPLFDLQEAGNCKGPVV